MLAKTYKDIFGDSVLGMERVLESMEENLSEIKEITQTISEDEVSDEVNSKIGEIEELLDRLLYELR